MDAPPDHVRRRTGRYTRSLRLPDCERRQMMYMSAYEIIMICIATMTLMLKLIELYNANRK